MSMAGPPASFPRKGLLKNLVLNLGATDKQILRLFGESACPCPFLTIRRKTRTKKTEQKSHSVLSMARLKYAPDTHRKGFFNKPRIPVPPRPPSGHDHHGAHGLVVVSSEHVSRPSPLDLRLYHRGRLAVRLLQARAGFRRRPCIR